MSVDAKIIVIGPFAPEIADCLDYPADNYKDVDPGTVVVAHYFHCSTRSYSNLLAEAVGTNLTDFRTHNIKPRNIRWTELSTAFGAEETDQLRRLVAAKFALIYLPDY